MPCVEPINNNNPEPWLSVKQLSRLIGMSPDWIRERVRKNAPDPLPLTRFGASIRFKWSEVEEYIDARRTSRDRGMWAQPTESPGSTERRRH